MSEITEGLKLSAHIRSRARALRRDVASMNVYDPQLDTSKLKPGYIHQVTGLLLVWDGEKWVTYDDWWELQQQAREQRG